MSDHFNSLGKVIIDIIHQGSNITTLKLEIRFETSINNCLILSHIIISFFNFVLSILLLNSIDFAGRNFVGFLFLLTLSDFLYSFFKFFLHDLPIKIIFYY